MQAFSKYQTVNDSVGLVVHSCLLVPYYSWCAWDPPCDGAFALVAVYVRVQDVVNRGTRPAG